MSNQLLPGLDVSRETLERLDIFANLVAKWTQRINLIAKTTVADIRTRHVIDSAQLVQLADGSPTSWVDLGAGGGFPGIVVAIIGHELWPDMSTTLVESDQRKATFLRQAARELGLPTVVLSERSESLSPLGAQILSARAFAPLDDLLAHAQRHCASDGIALLPKGRNFAAEIEDARRNWRFDLAILPSLTDQEGRILRIERIERA